MLAGASTKHFFVEDCYGSALTLSVEDKKVTGWYTPPAPADEVGTELLAVSPRKAVLTGEVVRDSGSVTIKGEWQHVRGPLTTGSFEMREKDASFCGWWRENSEDPESCDAHKWVWKKSKPLAPGDAAARECAQKPLARLVASVHMDRFTMFASWLFFVQTALQLASNLHGWSANAHLNLAFNVVYSLFYLAFLLSYVVQPPARCYIAGVALYFFGYVLFAVLFAFVCAGMDYHCAWYHAGSWCFLTGSLSLLWATRPESRCCCGKPSSLFLGSFAFLVGSVLFAADAMDLGVDALVPSGLAVFSAGRLFFVRGSETPRCNALFRGAAAR